MSKKSRNLLIMLVALCILAVGYFALSSFHKKEEAKEQEKQQQEEKGVPVFSVSADSITGLSWQNAGEEEYTFIKENKTWYLNSDRNFPLNQELFIKAIVSDVLDIRANRVIENVEDINQYGFDDPVLTFTITDNKNVSTEFALGQYNESTEIYYLHIEGTDRVYTVDGTLKVAFGLSLYDVANKESYPVMSADTVSAITVKAETNQINLVKNGKDWLVDKNGEKVKATTVKAEELLNKIISMSYFSEVEYNCPDNKLSEYGLDNPLGEIRLDFLDGSSFVLLVGKHNGEQEFYVKDSSKRAVMLLESENINGILNMVTQNFSVQ